MLCLPFISIIAVGLLALEVFDQLSHSGTVSVGRISGQSTNLKIALKEEV